MKRAEIKRRIFSKYGQSWGSKEYATWAVNHNGWSKMKKRNRKSFKSLIRREINRGIQESLEEYENNKS